MSSALEALFRPDGGFLQSTISCFVDFRVVFPRDSSIPTGLSTPANVLPHHSQHMIKRLCVPTSHIQDGALSVSTLLAAIFELRSAGQEQLPSSIGFPLDILRSRHSLYPGVFLGTSRVPEFGNQWDSVSESGFQELGPLTSFMTVLDSGTGVAPMTYTPALYPIITSPAIPTCARFCLLWERAVDVSNIFILYFYGNLQLEATPFLVGWDTHPLIPQEYTATVEETERCLDGLSNFLFSEEIGPAGVTSYSSGTTTDIVQLTGHDSIDTITLSQTVDFDAIMDVLSISEAHRSLAKFSGEGRVARSLYQLAMEHRAMKSILDAMNLPWPVVGRNPTMRVNIAGVDLPLSAWKVVVGHLGWSELSYKARTRLFGWAAGAVLEKVWDPSRIPGVASSTQLQQLYLVWTVMQFMWQPFGALDTSRPPSRKGESLLERQAAALSMHKLSEAKKFLTSGESTYSTYLIPA